MPKIEKTKKLRNLPVVVKTKPKATKTKKPKQSPVEYYNCLLTQAQQGWLDPQTGHKQKITACCKKCKLNAPSLATQRTEEIQKLITSYKQVGDSLSRLLQPLK